MRYQNENKHRIYIINAIDFGLVNGCACEFIRLWSYIHCKRRINSRIFIKLMRLRMRMRRHTTRANINFHWNLNQWIGCVYSAYLYIKCVWFNIYITNGKINSMENGNHKHIDTYIWVGSWKVLYIYCLIIISCIRTNDCLFSFTDTAKPIEMIVLLIDDCYKLFGTNLKHNDIIHFVLRRRSRTEREREKKINCFTNE